MNMIDKNKIKVVAFDADDTLWVNEPFFRSAEAKFFQILEKYIEKRDFQDELYANEVKNLHLFGYGAKGFMLSMIETALELTNYKISGQDIQIIINMGKEILSYPINKYEGIDDVLKTLGEKYKVICITKGDLLDQESKVARSGLGELFEEVHVVNEKNPETYQNILNGHNIDVSEFIMIGNSMKSDVLPVVELGASAVHIPCEAQWAHEVVEPSIDQKEKFLELKKATELLNYL